MEAGLNDVDVVYRAATLDDVPGMARIRAAEWETEQYWRARIAGYMEGKLHPREALAPRIVFVAASGNDLVGLVAGHLTRRYGCDGELEWIDVVREQRRAGLASALLSRLAEWFVAQDAFRICVDPGNETARSFYRDHGAGDLNQHWLVWSDVRTVLSER